MPSADGELDGRFHPRTQCKCVMPDSPHCLKRPLRGPFCPLLLVRTSGRNTPAQQRGSYHSEPQKGSAYSLHPISSKELISLQNCLTLTHLLVHKPRSMKSGRFCNPTTSWYNLCQGNDESFIDRNKKDNLLTFSGRKTPLSTRREKLQPTLSW